MTAAPAPPDQTHCACPRIDATACAEVRFPRTAALARGGALDSYGVPFECEPCECDCHDGIIDNDIDDLSDEGHL